MTDLLKDVFVDGVIGSIARIAVAVLGWIMDKVIAMIIGFAQYSDFVNNKQLIEGWTVVRDICNMFFILILLFIAFAVILRMESYSIKKSLPKLLIMAVLINFSRTICGILIDFSQIIMLTFIGPITAGAGNFHNVLQIDEFLKAVAKTDGDKMDLTDAAVYYVIAVIFMVVATVVMVAVLISFVMRIVMFWVYIVLSPLAFLMSSFPAGQKYAGQFWGDFTKYLLNGPVLAFFLWLSLYILSNLDTKEIGMAFEQAPIGILVGSNFASFVMAIGMLVGGLTISAQIGGMGASWGASTVSNLKNKGLGAAKAIGKRVSGYDAVADRASAYMSMRRSARDDKIRKSVGNIAGKIGKAKEFVGKDLIAKPLSGAWNKMGGGARAQRLKEELITDKAELKPMKEHLGTSKEGIKFSKDRLKNEKFGLETLMNKRKVDEGDSYKIEDKEYKYSNGYWENNEDNNVLSHEDFKQEARGHVLSREAEIGSKEAAIAPLDSEVLKREADIVKKEGQQKSAEKSQKVADIAGRGLVTAGAATLGFMSGGVLGGIYGAGVGQFGIPSIAEDIKNAGDVDMNLVANHEAETVNKERTTAKEVTTEENRKTMNDETKSIFKRMASALELISRKETTVAEIKEMRTNIADKFQNKTQSNFEGEVSRNYKGASKLFDFAGANGENNKKKVRESFEDGSLSLKELDSESLLLCGQQIGEGMKQTTFKRQYDDLSDAKKESVKTSLSSAGTYDAREKLARIETIDKAFGDDTAGKIKFTQKLNIKVIQEILNEGTSDQRKSLADNILINGKLNDKVIAKDLAERLSDKDIPASRTILKALEKAAGIFKKADGGKSKEDEEDDEA